MGKKNKNKTMGSVPSSYYELNVDSVIADEELHDVDGNKVYEEVLKTAEEEIQKARDLLVQSIGEEELPRECLGVIDLSGGEVAPPSTPEEEKKDDGLSQKQKQQKGGYNGWWWWRK
jgi:ferritin-like protein